MQYFDVWKYGKGFGRHAMLLQSMCDTCCVNSVTQVSTVDFHNHLLDHHCYSSCHPHSAGQWSLSSGTPCTIYCSWGNL